MVPPPKSTTSAPSPLILIEQHLRGRQRIEDDVKHFRADFLDATDAVFDAGGHAMNDVKIGLQLAPEHADGIEHSIVPVDVVVLQDRMDEHVRLPGC